ncbi:hypothetical protein OR221_0112 [Microbacterium laevaniformans OR221]|jgi:hypothetical protein|nr:hypothetical protein OR221_0112 [Microbacterium laevaniformans OR221]
MMKGADVSEGGSETSAGSDMETSSEAVARARRNRALIVGAVAIAVVVLAVAIGVAAAQNGASNAGAPTPATTTGSAVSAGTSPTASTSTASDPETTAPADGSERPTLPPVPLDGIAEVPAGLGVRVTSIDAVEGEAVVPGEIAGPALRVTVEIDNSSADAIDLRTATVTLAYGDPLQPGNPISKPAGASFPDTVEPGQSASGTFVFEVPKDQRDRVQIAVDLSIDDPIIAFEGSVG